MEPHGDHVRVANLTDASGHTMVSGRICSEFICLTWTTESTMHMSEHFGNHRLNERPSSADVLVSPRR